LAFPDFHPRGFSGSLSRLYGESHCGDEQGKHSGEENPEGRKSYTSKKKTPWTIRRRQGSDLQRPRIKFNICSREEPPQKNCGSDGERTHSSQWSKHPPPPSPLLLKGIISKEKAKPTWDWSTMLHVLPGVACKASNQYFSLYFLQRSATTACGLEPPEILDPFVN
jgi:hypothetical protein